MYFTKINQLATIILMFSHFTIKAQKDTTVNCFKTNRGIYFYFENILRNTPAAPLDSFVIKEKTQGQKIMSGGGEYTLECLNKDLKNKNLLNEIREEYIGVSDGECFYISDNYTITQNAIFKSKGLTKCLYNGPYIVAPIQKRASSIMGGGVIPSLIKIGQGFIIDLKNGITKEISNSSLKKVLSEHKQLLDEYNAKKGSLHSYTSEIITKVNEVENQKSTP